MIHCQCPHCKETNTFPDRYVGRTGPCRSCGALMLASNPKLATYPDQLSGIPTVNSKLLGIGIGFLMISPLLVVIYLTVFVAQPPTAAKYREPSAPSLDSGGNSNLIENYKQAWKQSGMNAQSETTKKVALWKMMDHLDDQNLSHTEKQATLDQIRNSMERGEWD